MSDKTKTNKAMNDAIRRAAGRGTVKTPPPPREGDWVRRAIKRARKEA